MLLVIWDRLFIYMMMMMRDLFFLEQFESVFIFNMNEWMNNILGEFKMKKETPIHVFIINEPIIMSIIIPICLKEDFKIVSAIFLSLDVWLSEWLSNHQTKKKSIIKDHHHHHQSIVIIIFSQNDDDDDDYNSKMRWWFFFWWLIEILIIIIFSC